MKKQSLPWGHGRVWARASHGFSLLEALVALAIASIAFAALYRSVGQSAYTSIATESRVEAALMAHTILAAGVYAEDFSPQLTGAKGDWHWTIQIMPNMAQLDAHEAGQAMLPVARLEIDIRHAGRPSLVWTGWKPYRGTP